MKFFKFFCLLVVVTLCPFSKLLAGTYLVTNTNDSGPGSLDEAILNANSDSQSAIISFAISTTGPYNLGSSRWLVSLNGITIDGNSQLASGQGSGTDQRIIINKTLLIMEGFVTIKNLVFQNLTYGILIGNNNNNVIENCLIENCTFENIQLGGIMLTNDHHNTIKNNRFYGCLQFSILLWGNDNVVINNKIGVDDNNVTRSCTIGIQISGNNNIIGGLGGENIIANNSNGPGILINGGTGNRILNNKIYNNNNYKAIDNSNGLGNIGKVAPEIESIVGLTINGKGMVGDLVQVFYNNGVAENALAFVGETSVKSDGKWSLPIPMSSSTYNPNGGNSYVATATDQQGNTSQLSAPFLLTSCVVTTTADNGDNTPVAGSLRAAINCANAKSDHAKVEFALPGNGPHTINILTSLPEITNPVKVTIDAYGGIGGEPEIIISAVNPNLICFKSSSTPIVIKNLTIRNFRRPIYITNSANIEISGNKIDCPAYPGNNFEAVQVNFTDGFVVKNNIINKFSTGLASTTNKNGIIQDNTISENNGGMYLTSMEDLQIKNNIISNNKISGLTFAILPGAQVKNIIIEGNTIENNGYPTQSSISHGIQVVNNGNISNFQILKNRISGNFNHGIELNQCQNLEIRENVITSNQADGINLSYSTLITIIGNRIGVDQNNNVLGNQGFGINLAYSSSNIKIGLENSRNIIKNNSLGGISVKGEKNNIAYNTISNNNSGNAIFNNEGSGNHGKAIPIITSIVGFTISGTSETNDLIQVFYNDGVAQNAISFVGEKQAVNGQWSITIPISSTTYNSNGGNNYVATATDQNGNTSELSTPFLLSSCIVTTTEDNGNNATPVVGSLRAAINCANAKSEQGQVCFALPEEGPYYFELDVQLPNLNNSNGIILDGSTQLESKAGAGDNQRIILQGNGSIDGFSSEANGTSLVGNSNQIKNIQFQNFSKAINFNCDHNLISAVTIKGAAEGVVCDGNINKVLDSEITGCTSSAISLVGNALTVDGNQIGESQRGIMIMQSFDVNIINNYIGIRKNNVAMPINQTGISLDGSINITIKGNVVGHVVSGIKVDKNVHDCNIESNYVGVSLAGTSIPVVEKGIEGNGYISPGGSTSTRLTIIKNNVANCGFAGVYCSNIDSSLIKENFIGTNLNYKVYNNGDYGIFLAGANYNRIESNWIYYHQKDGIVVAPVYRDPGQHNIITQNYISGNGSSSKAINIFYPDENALFTNGNNGEAKPVFDPSPVLNSSNNLILSGTAGANRRIEIFKGAGPYQSAVYYLGSVTTGSSGTWAFTVENIQPTPYYFAATATDLNVEGTGPNNNTSELSTFTYCNAPSVNTPDYSIYTFCVGLPIAMTNLSVLKINNHQPGVTYLWDINNDNTIDVSTQNALELYRFNTEGAVPVKLTAKNGCYSSTVETGVEVVDLTIKTPQPEICKGQSLPLNVKPHGGILGRFLWFRDNQPIPEQQAPTNTITESGTYSVVFKDFSCPTNESDFNNAPSDQNGKIAFSKIEIAKGSCPEPTCGNCMSSFVPESEKDYVLSVWVKEDWTQPKQDYLNAGVKLTFYIDQFDGTSLPDNSLVPLKVVPGSPMVEGWQKLEGTFKAPLNNVGIGISLLSSEAVDIYYDDLRIQRDNSSMKSFVYDKKDMKLMSELDERNFATFYEYDQEGKLIRVKKETERGIMTIQESQTNIYKVENLDNQ
ncbi:MAG: right-handed parallel beta-helix repeat-containing protein [Sporocytophaga sp.]|uniref:right-handed parallel beta-helix repeat-containing protein n=1 Tax=Sporocytophaga sp. TaxID=2231183 RepID=UPI001B2A9515|nr:right-handed parallel beta-helix repeat-containing protein [Sporocytophaga sp.]MBO9702127.1 right-handed parallel beta-helix repeat-containing protein [Sporocytophaga sp.]